MNTDRLLREIERRLADLPERARAEAIDAVREEIARDRRRLDPSSTVETERERRIEAETLREVLEAINRQASLEDTMQEVLKQLSRIVSFDSCSVALADAQGTFRVIAARGFPDPSVVLGITFRDPLSEVLRTNRQPLGLADVQVDERFAKVDGTTSIRSWAGIPLVVESDTIGILSLDRHRVDPFSDEDLHRAKAVAFSAAAAIRKAQLLEQLRRYATLMELTVRVDEAVFAGEPAETVGHVVLEGALRLGGYVSGLLLLSEDGVPARVTATSDSLKDMQGRTAPAALDARVTGRLEGEALAAASRELGVAPPTSQLYLVPIATDKAHLGTLALFDVNGESPDDQLMEAYASRCAAAYLHARR